MRPTIDLDWWRAAEGYHLVRQEPDNAPVKVKNEWGDEDPWKYTPLADAGGYFRPEYRPLVDKILRAREQEPYERETWDSLWICPKSGEFEPVRPFHGAPDLFKEFAAIQTPEQVLDFVNRNGLLGSGMEEDVGYILDRAGGAHGLLVRRNHEIADNQQFAHHLVDAHMAVSVQQVGPNQPMTLTFRPRSLLDGLRLQLAYGFTEEDPPRACRHCGKIFEGRRPDATFCSPKCRERWFSLERTRRKHRAKPGR
jgi:hypothetical protein